MKKIISENYKSIRVKPINFNYKDDLLFKNEYVKTIPETYYLFDKNIYLNNNNLYKYKYLNKYLSETKMDTDNWNFFKNSLKKLMNKSFPKHISYIDQASWVIDDKSINYFHWMTDVLSRIALIPPPLLDNYPIMVPKKLIYKSFIRESLELLKTNYITYEENDSYKIGKMLITSHVAPAGNFNKNFILTVRDQLLKTIDTRPNTGARLWVSRKKQNRRTLVNEDEILEILLEFGFQIILPEELSFKEQLKLFSGASLLAGTHGAALTNAMFMETNSSILEIRASNDTHRNPFFTLASEFDLRYYYLLADPKVDSLESDLYLNPKNFKNTLMSILN